MSHGLFQRAAFVAILCGSVLAAATAISLAGEAPKPITIITMEQLQELTGQKDWKCNQDSLIWMSDAIERIQAVQLGETRRSLEFLFQAAGDVGSRFQHRFEYREHREDLLLYVEVEFDRDPAKLASNPDADQISKISVPFIAAVQRKPGQLTPTTWVDEAVQRMQTIKPGMTRKQLLEVFRGGGGLFNDLHQGFVSRDCPYFRVDVDFEPVGRPARDAEGRAIMNGSYQDRIIKISKPNLAFDPAD